MWDTPGAPPIAVLLVLALLFLAVCLVVHLILSAPQQPPELSDLDRRDGRRDPGNDHA